METNELNEKVLDFFKAFCQVDRLKIAGLLAQEALSASQVAERLGIRPKEANDHLSYLTHFGYLKNRDNVYSLDKDAFSALSREVLQGSRPRSKAEDFEGEDYDRKVLKDFISPEGRLSAVPTQNKKRSVILHYVAQDFEIGTRYPEKQVNEILRKRFDDPASLRRYLVDDGVMQRENGIYWRVEP